MSAAILRGTRFGLLVVRRADGPRCVCHCDCGATFRVLAERLSAGAVRSCGCQPHAAVGTPPARGTDLTGRRFGRLTVIDYAGNCEWRARCDCGATWRGRGSALRRGATKSCGCLAASAVLGAP